MRSPTPQSLEANVQLVLSEFPSDQQFIADIAYHLQNVIKQSTNSFLHGHLLSSYLRRYLASSDASHLNILDIGTARGFSALCMAHCLSTEQYPGKVFTLDILPNRTPMLWNGPTDISHGEIDRLQLLSPWKDLVDQYLVFLASPSYHALKILDLPVIHFAYIDGSHYFSDVRIEIDYVVSRFDQRSVLIFDDYDTSLFPGVVKAVNYLASLNKHSGLEFITIQNCRKLAIFKFGNV